MMKKYAQLWTEIGKSEKRKHKTSIVDQSVSRAEWQRGKNDGP